MTRTDIIDAVRSAVEGHSWALACYEAGSAAFGRADEWSDVDLCVAVEDGRVEDGFTAIEGALETLAGIESRWVVNPASHLKPQRYYRLRSADPWLIVDVGVFERSTPPAERYVERHRHGTPRVLFDRIGFASDVPRDADSWRSRLRRRHDELCARFEFLGALAVKSARRGEAAEAVVFYQAFVLRPLVEMLRMRHDPWRHDYDVRYLRFDLPDDVRRRVWDLWFLRDLDDLVEKHARAAEWLRDELRTLDVDRIPLPA